MSEPILTNPEVLTDHTDVTCSTSTERIATGHNATLTWVEALLHQIDDVSIQTLSVGGKTTLDWVMKQDLRCGCWLTGKPEVAMKAITHSPNHGRRRDSTKRSGMLSTMGAQARDQRHNSLEKDDIPVVSEANILSASRRLHLSRGEVLQRGAINVSKGLSRDFKTNSPCGFGAKTTVMELVKFDRWGFGLNHD